MEIGERRSIDITPTDVGIERYEKEHEMDSKLWQRIELDISSRIKNLEQVMETLWLPKEAIDNRRQEVNASIAEIRKELARISDIVSGKVESTEEEKLQAKFVSVGGITRKLDSLDKRINNPVEFWKEKWDMYNDPDKAWARLRETFPSETEE